MIKPEIGYIWILNFFNPSWIHPWGSYRYQYLKTDYIILLICLTIKFNQYVSELTLIGSQPEYTFTKVDLRDGYLVKMAVYPAIKVAAIPIRFLGHIMYENKKMYKNESLQKQNKIDRRSVMGRTIGGFSNGDICTLKREMEITENLSQPK